LIVLGIFATVRPNNTSHQRALLRADDGSNATSIGVDSQQDFVRVELSQAVYQFRETDDVRGQPPEPPAVDRN